MSSKEGGKSLDVLGVQPVSKAIEIVTDGSVRGAGAFLSRICLPAAEEFGYLLQDKVRGWRAQNLASMESKAAKKYKKLHGESEAPLHAHPRIANKIAEAASWEDTEEVQDLWANLLASSCNLGGDDQSSLLYINLLSQMTPSEASIINALCERAAKVKSPAGVIMAEGFEIGIKDLLEIAVSQDLHQIDVEVDHIRELGLISTTSGIDSESGIVSIDITSLGLNFYARCQGYVGDPIVYYNL